MHMHKHVFVCLCRSGYACVSVYLFVCLHHTVSSRIVNSAICRLSEIISVFFIIIIEKIVFVCMCVYVCPCLYICVLAHAKCVSVYPHLVGWEGLLCVLVYVVEQYIHICITDTYA